LKVLVYKDSLFTSKRKQSPSIRKNIRTCTICTICIVNNASRIENFTVQTHQLVSFALLGCTSLSKMLLLQFHVASDNQTYLVLPVKCPIFLSDFNYI
jgi:hypothetical protein